MRTFVPLSPSSEDFSILSSLDALSLSTDSPHSSAATGSGRTDDEYELVFGRRTSVGTSLSLSSASSASVPQQQANESGRPTPTPPIQPTLPKSIARRGRKRALQAGREGGVEKTHRGTQSHVPTPVAVVVKQEPGFIKGQPTVSGLARRIPQRSQQEMPIPVAVAVKQELGLNRLEPIASKTARGGPQHSRQEVALLTVPLPSSEHRLRGTRRTRRGGKRSRLRQDKAAVRDALALGAEDQSPALPEIAFEDEKRWEDGRSRLIDGQEEDEEDEVEDMSVLDEDAESVFGTPRPSVGRRMKVEGSVMSSEDAKTSIDCFFSGSAEFMSNKANKLRLWQALCIELGLVQMTGDDELSDLPRHAVPKSKVAISDASPPSSRASTPRPELPLLPQSLSRARAILKGKGHVNIAEYIEARTAGGEANYAGLLYASRSAMIRNTRKSGNFAKLNTVKSEWLDPLLRDFGFKRGRVAAASAPPL